MKKNTLRLMVLAFSASFMFVGCGSSSSTTEPTPAPTAAPTATPAPTAAPTPEPTDTPVDEGSLLPSFR